MTDAQKDAIVAAAKKYVEWTEWTSTVRYGHVVPDPNPRTELRDAVLAAEQRWTVEPCKEMRCGEWVLYRDGHAILYSTHPDASVILDRIARLLNEDDARK